MSAWMDNPEKMVLLSEPYSCVLENKAVTTHSVQADSI